MTTAAMAIVVRLGDWDENNAKLALWAGWNEDNLKDEFMAFQSEVWEANEYTEPMPTADSDWISSRWNGYCNQYMCEMVNEHIGEFPIWAFNVDELVQLGENMCVTRKGEAIEDMFDDWQELYCDYDEDMPYMIMVRTGDNTRSVDLACEMFKIEML